MRAFFYVVSRDFGFAPNPFHGICTLATCKPRVRRRADVGDWVIGMGGAELHATGRCVFAMQLTRTMTFDEYWNDPDFFDKRPVMNGSRKMMIGDNIYHRDLVTRGWHQEFSHHSEPDGKIKEKNLRTDTSADRVLASEHFYYFGRNAPSVPPDIMSEIGYVNRIDHDEFDLDRCRRLLEWLDGSYGSRLNEIMGSPFQFHMSGHHYSGTRNKVVPGADTHLPPRPAQITSAERRPKPDSSEKPTLGGV